MINSISITSPRFQEIEVTPTKIKSWREEGYRDALAGKKYDTWRPWAEGGTISLRGRHKRQYMQGYNAGLTHRLIHSPDNPFRKRE